MTNFNTNQGHDAGLFQRLHSYHGTVAVQFEICKIATWSSLIHKMGVKFIVAHDYFNHAMGMVLLSSTLLICTPLILSGRINLKRFILCVTESRSWWKTGKLPNNFCQDCCILIFWPIEQPVWNNIYPISSWVGVYNNIQAIKK